MASHDADRCDDAVAAALLAAIEARDPSTAAHCRAVGRLAGVTALVLGLRVEDAEAIATGGLLHDLGKLAWPDTLLTGHAVLTLADRAAIALHPAVGRDILARLGPVSGRLAAAAVIAGPTTSARTGAAIRWVSPVTRSRWAHGSWRSPTPGRR